MNNPNPYRAPAAEVADIPEHGTLELAGRGHRFGAAVIDALIALAFIVPIIYLMGIYDRLGRDLSLAEDFAIDAVAALVFVVLQLYFLKKSGQTIGKRIVGIRIVDLNDKAPGLWTLLGKRYGVMFLVQAVPAVGPWISLADVLVIFRQDRRCIHDLIAGTRVVVSGAKQSSTTWIVAPAFIVALVGIAAAIIADNMYDDTPPPPKPAAAKGKPRRGGQAPLPAAGPSKAGAPAPNADSPQTPPPQAASPQAAQPKADFHAQGPQDGPSQAVPSLPAAPAAANDTPGQKDADALRKCLNLKDAAAVIRCSQAGK